jgi:hypothetical protein
MSRIVLILSFFFISLPVLAIDGQQPEVIGYAMGPYMGSNNLDQLIKWSIGIIYLLWMSWMGLSSFSSWADNESSIADLSYSIVNSAAVTMFVVWIIT